MSTLHDTAATPTAEPPPEPPLARQGYALADALWADHGAVMLSGTQALLRLALMQKSLDAARGWATEGFISGYRGSPLGMVDQAVWKAGERYRSAGIRFVPAVNEELAATQVLGTQRVESDPERTVDGVFALWYGKGPGVDRAGDALKHGNAYGSSPHGGVLVVAGDDHGCVSSSMPHQSDHAFMGWSVPVLQPASVAEMVEFGLYGWALSRYSGAWVGLAALSEVVESTATVDVDLITSRVAAWAEADDVAAATGHQPPADGLHYRWPDLPSLRIESRLADKLAAVAAFARVNSIDREVIECAQARVGIVTCGKAHLDLMEVLRRLEISPSMLAAAGLRLYKVGLSFPIETTRMAAFARGLSEILVIEEKGAVVETQLRELFYNAPVGERPAIVGKRDVDGTPLVSALGELRPSRLIELVAHWLARHFPGDQALGDHFQHVRDFTPPPLLANDADSVKRLPYFCAGCPHNTSTQVPQGSTARAGIGCHFMANWMERDTAGLIQMGGEGVDWVSHALFTRVPHVFQNLGDGTYYHSGYLAIRQAVAAKANITYKILFNDAVAMTGGQPVDGPTSVDAIARQVESEGVKQVVVLSDDIGKYADQQGRFPAGTEFHDRAELDAVQRRLREVPGVTVLIYEQTCAAEKRRRRKKGELADPPRRLAINEAVCEGCGDCSVQSNYVAVLPHETALGRKRRIDQTACNKDYRCADGFCPSFVSLTGARPRRKAGALADPRSPVRAAFEARVAALPHPREIRPHLDTTTPEAPYDLLVTGVGGTGIVTVGAVIAMAAHLEGRHASVLDFMGFAQKGGAVLSFVRLGANAEAPGSTTGRTRVDSAPRGAVDAGRRPGGTLNQVRIDTQQADAVLACDLVVGAAPEALQTVRHGRTRVLANIHEVPVAESLRNPDADLKRELLLAKLRYVAGEQNVATFDAQQLAEDFLGDTVTANVLALGYAWQRGLVPVSLAALQRAITLNGVAVAANLQALAIGRLAAADPQGCEALLGRTDHQGEQAPTLEAFIPTALAHLTAYQDAAYAQRWLATVHKVQQREAQIAGASPDAGPARPLTLAVARSLLKLMAIKDEYEVARLYTDGSFQRQLTEQFEGDVTMQLHLAPPLLARPKNGQPPRKLTFSGRWMLPAMRLLARAKVLRGGVFDLFGRTAERRLERELLRQYEARIDELLAGLGDRAATQAGAAPPPNHLHALHDLHAPQATPTAPTQPTPRLPDRLALAVAIAQVPMAMRGYGHVKLAQVALARAREAELLQRWDPARYPRPARPGARDDGSGGAAAGSPPAAGQLRGIPVVSAPAGVAASGR